MSMNFPAEQELIQSITGYAGYRSTAQRGTSDLRLREYLTSEIKQMAPRLETIAIRLAVDNFKASLHVERLNKQLMGVIKSLRSPSYNDSTFFNHPRLDSDRLSDLYDSEARINDLVHYIASEIAILDEEKNADDVSSFLFQLFDAVDSLNHCLVEREFLLADTEEHLL
jgi:hypothetical protein